MSYELRQYSFGETIGKGFNLYFSNFIPIVLMSIISQIPVVILMQLTGFGNPENLNFGADFFISYALILILSVFVGAFLSAYITHLVSKKFLETAPASPESVSTSILPFVFPLIGLSILIGLVVMLGMIFLIVPGIIFALGLSISTQIMVIEKRKIRESMKRSWELTKGKKGHILGILLVSGIISGIINVVLVAILRVAIQDTLIVTYLNYLISAITSPVIYCILVVVYYNIRIEKEGFNIEHLTQQFTLAEEPGPSVES